MWCEFFGEAQSADDFRDPQPRVASCKRCFRWDGLPHIIYIYTFPPRVHADDRTIARVGTPPSRDSMARQLLAKKIDFGSKTLGHALSEWSMGAPGSPKRRDS